MKYTEYQLTSDHKGHLLNPRQIFSPDGKWIVYDTRNDGTQIGSTPTIEMVHIETGEIREVYRTSNQTEHGPGVGAASFSPVAEQVIFIHGIRNADAGRPYGFTRRTGVMVNMSSPGVPVFMDARQITAPFTPGALRGGTHAHVWSPDGKHISFTYNDYVLEQLSAKQPDVQDLRMVGIMFPKKVEVSDSHDLENHDGEMFSVIISDVTEQPAPGSDEIDKAFDESWIGENGYTKLNGELQKRAIAFQGNVKNEKGETITEVFVVDLPEEIIADVNGHPLEGTATTRPGVPAGVRQRRITKMDTGVEGPRHWLQTTPKGDLIAFLSRDKEGYINIFAVSPNGGTIKQLTFHRFDIQTGFNFSPDGRYVAYGAENAVHITAVASGESHQVTENFSDDDAPAGPVSWSPDGKILAYNRYVGRDGQRFLQVFLLKEI